MISLQEGLSGRGGVVVLVTIEGILVTKQEKKDDTSETNTEPGPMILLAGDWIDVVDLSKSDESG